MNILYSYNRVSSYGGRAVTLSDNVWKIDGGVLEE